MSSRFPQSVVLVAGRPHLAGPSSHSCHNDLAPWNTVFINEHAVGFIDWDLAAPGPRLWDVAFALWHFVPLYGDPSSDPFDVTSRRIATSWTRHWPDPCIGKPVTTEKKDTAVKQPTAEGTARFSRYLRTRERGAWTAAFHELHPEPWFIPTGTWRVMQASPGALSPLAASELGQRELLISSAALDDDALVAAETALVHRLDRASVLYLVLVQGCNFARHASSRQPQPHGVHQRSAPQSKAGPFLCRPPGVGRGRLRWPGGCS